MVPQQKRRLPRGSPVCMSIVGGGAPDELMATATPQRPHARPSGPTESASSAEEEQNST